MDYVNASEGLCVKTQSIVRSRLSDGQKESWIWGDKAVSCEAKVYRNSIHNDEEGTYHLKRYFE